MNTKVLQHLLLLILLLSYSHHIWADKHSKVEYPGGKHYIFRYSLCDQKGSNYSLQHPGRWLSRKAIERRTRQGLLIDSTDLPVSNLYIKTFRQKADEIVKSNKGVSTEWSIIGGSRWQNTLLVRSNSLALLNHLAQLPCVKASRQVWISPDSIAQTAKRSKCHDQLDEFNKTPDQSYGKSYEQIHKLSGNRLHDMGMHGEGMTIAILDGGFQNADRIPALTSINIVGSRDFVTPASPSIFAETDHGTKVLSVMGALVPFYYIGTAPKASYWLLRSEDQQSEQEVEEDYWTMAAEFADSVGCDIINSSLGYNEYDNRDLSYRLFHLDGKTAFISRTASMLAQKGIILINSAGNSGMGHWKKIGFPADADHILTVGAITADKPYDIAAFSSVGPTQDGRVKPDVVAIGAPTFLINGRGILTQDMGTSFSTPTICGLVACLWQALPHLTAEDIIQLIRLTSNNYEHPDNVYGFGVPNFWQAYMLGRLEAVKGK